jgi:hypothetical protein
MKKNVTYEKKCQVARLYTSFEAQALKTGQFFKNNISHLFVPTPGTLYYGMPASQSDLKGSTLKVSHDPVETADYPF